MTLKCIILRLHKLSYIPHDSICMTLYGQKQIGWQMQDVGEELTQRTQELSLFTWSRGTEDATSMATIVRRRMREQVLGNSQWRDHRVTNKHIPRLLKKRHATTQVVQTWGKSLQSSTESDRHPKTERKLSWRGKERLNHFLLEIISCKVLFFFFFLANGNLSV